MEMQHGKTTTRPQNNTQRLNYQSCFKLVSKSPVSNSHPATLR